MDTHTELSDEGLVVIGMGAMGLAQSHAEWVLDDVAQQLASTPASQLPTLDVCMGTRPTRCPH